MSNEFNDLIDERIFILDGIEYKLKYPIGDTGSFEGPSLELPSHLATWQTYIKKYDVCIQAGGNAGLYCKILSNRFEIVYTFEPDSLLFHCLCLNNQNNRVMKLNAALGRESGRVTLIPVCPSNMGMNQVKIDENSKIPLMTIDSLDLDALDFIQLDVEGYEFNILEGGINTITKYHPVISCENGNELIEMILTPLGYTKVAQNYADSTYAVIS